MKVREKLTDQQIKEMEAWAEKKKDNPSITAIEKTAVETIEDFKKSNWSGYRVTGNAEVTKESVQKELDELMKKEV